MAWKTVEEMSPTEVVSEAENLSYYAQSCRTSGQGINSKETIRFRKCSDRMIKEKLAPPEDIADIECRWDERQEEFRDLLIATFRGGCTLAEMRRLFV